MCINEAVKYLQDFDQNPEYQAGLNHLIRSYNKSVSVRKDLRWYLERNIEGTERTIRESPDIGTVKDNGRLGMKMAYEDVLKMLGTLERLETQGLNRESGRK